MTTSKSNVRSTEENELFSEDSFTVAPNNAENMTNIALMETTFPSSPFQEDTKLTKDFSIPTQKASSNFTTNLSVIYNESIQTSTYTTQYFTETESKTLQSTGTFTERPTNDLTFSTDDTVTTSSTNFTPDLFTESQKSSTQSEAKNGLIGFFEPSTEAKTESFTSFDGLDSTAITTGIEDLTEYSDRPTIFRAPFELTNTDVTTNIDQTLTSNTPSTIKFASTPDSEIYTDQKSIFDSTSVIKSTSVTDPGGSPMTDPEFIKIDKTNASTNTNDKNEPIEISTSTKRSETKIIDITSKVNEVEFYRPPESTHLGREQNTTGSSTITEKESASISSLTTKLLSTSKSITPEVSIDPINTTAVADTTSTNTYPETSLEPVTGFSPVEITATTDFLTTFVSTTEEDLDRTKTQVTSPPFSTIKSTVPEPILSKLSTVTEKPFSSKTFPAVRTSQTILMFETSSTDLIKLPVSENVKTSEATTAFTTTSESVSQVILTIRPSATQANPDFWKRSTDNADTTKIGLSKITERPPIPGTIESSTRGRLEPISYNR